LNSLKYTMWMLRTPDQRVVGTIEYLLLWFFSAGPLLHDGLVVGFLEDSRGVQV
jgi:hypothetical protein